MLCQSNDKFHCCCLPGFHEVSFQLSDNHLIGDSKNSTDTQSFGVLAVLNAFGRFFSCHGSVWLSHNCSWSMWEHRLCWLMSLESFLGLPSILSCSMVIDAIWHAHELVFSAPFLSCLVSAVFLLFAFLIFKIRLVVFYNGSRCPPSHLCLCPLDILVKSVWFRKCFLGSVLGSNAICHHPILVLCCCALLFSTSLTANWFVDPNFVAFSNTYLLFSVVSYFIVHA